jgi:DNA-binding beta-propeller fold protein YncE
VHKPLRLGVSALVLTLGVGALVLTLVKLPVVSPPTSAVAAAAPPRVQPRVEVLAGGLDNPRGLAVTPDGKVLVAEAGTGGNGACLPSPENPDGQVCLGDTGTVVEVTPAGLRRVISGLPSVAAKKGRNAIGPSDVWLADPGTALVSMGLVNETPRRKELGPLGASLGTVRSYHLSDGSGVSSLVADTSAWEDRVNPDGGRRDSNPIAVLGLDDGRVAVVDAGGNRLLAVDRQGAISLLAVFPLQEVAAPPGSGFSPTARLKVESVPTSVVRGPDGALYVGELSGFPFVRGAARIWRLVPGQQPTVYATGFTNIIDLAFDRQGRLYVLEISKTGLRSPDKTGSLLRVEPDGTRTELLPTQLSAPGGMAFAPDGTLLITNRTTSADTGEVLKVHL